MLEGAGFLRQVDRELFPRPTPLPTGLSGWLGDFRDATRACGRARGRPAGADRRNRRSRRGTSPRASRSGWIADYVRLRFVAEKPLRHDRRADGSQSPRFWRVGLAQRQHTPRTRMPKDAKPPAKTAVPSGCTRGKPAPPPPLPEAPKPPSVDEAEPSAPPPGTMVDQPLAVLQALDKITARVKRLTVNVGRTVPFGTLTIEVDSCRKAPPEGPAGIGRFPEDHRRKAGRWRRNWRSPAGCSRRARPCRPWTIPSTTYRSSTAAANPPLRPPCRSEDRSRA